jgi:Fur family ferric uptake transcriptional regulator
MNINKENILKSRNIRPTAMRILVLEILAGLDAAIGLPELEQYLDRADKTTLYRTLKVFEEKKLIHRIDDGTGSVKYALCPENCECLPEDLHVHFLCTNCNKTFCLPNIPVPTIPLPGDFSLESVNMVVKGICSECNRVA